jgi:hypothetical protein
MSNLLPIPRGWRLIKPGEQLQAGDKYNFSHYPSKGWLETCNAGCSVPARKQARLSGETCALRYIRAVTKINEAKRRATRKSAPMVRVLPPTGITTKDRIARALDKLCEVRSSFAIYTVDTPTWSKLNDAMRLLEEVQTLNQ